MRASLVIGILLMSAAVASASQTTSLAARGPLPPSAWPAPHTIPVHVTPPPPRGTFYCQPPSCEYAVNASTAFESEVADDLPESLAGWTIGEVTLYVTEWGSDEWIEPAGVVIRFYDGRCPPQFEPAIICSVAWSELTTNLECMNPPVRIVYAATAVLPTPVTITTGMSLGAYVVTDWPHQPYAGLTLTEPDELHGCGELYWDNETHGAPRWTPLSTVTEIAADLAYCLGETGTGLKDEISWGRVKNLFK